MNLRRWDERDRLIAVIDGLRADKDRAGEGIQIARAALTSRRVLLDLIRMVLGGDLLATVDADD